MIAFLQTIFKGRPGNLKSFKVFLSPRRYHDSVIKIKAPMTGSKHIIDFEKMEVDTMKTMKKMLIALLAVAVALSAAIVPAMAEAEIRQNIQQNQPNMNGQQGGMPGMNGPRNGQQGQPYMNGPRNGQQGGMPGMNPPQNGQQGQPYMNGPRNGQNQMPGNNGCAPQKPDDTQDEAPANDDANAPAEGNSAEPNNMPRGEKGRRGMIDFKALAEDGTLSQETVDAIESYMSSHAPNGKGGMDKKARSGMNGLLDELLKAEVITQEEYDAVSAKISADNTNAAEAPAEPSAPEAPEAPNGSEAPEAPAAPEAPTAPESSDSPAE